MIIISSKAEGKYKYEDLAFISIEYFYQGILYANWWGLNTFND